MAKIRFRQNLAESVCHTGIRADYLPGGDTMPKPIHLFLPKDERAALMSIAEQDIRPPTDTLRWLVVREAVKRGLLSSDTRQPQPTQTEPKAAHVS